MNAFEACLQNEIQGLTKGRLRDFTPSLQIAVLHKGKLIGQLKLGEKRTYFDLASLTKIIFTVSTLMHLVDQKKISVMDRVSKHWPEFPYKDVRVRDLLTHSAGFTAWAPFYKSLRRMAPDELARREKIKQMMFALPRGKAHQKSVYSDVDFLCLGFFLEQACHKDLLKIWQRQKNRWPKNQLHFVPGHRPPFRKSLYAPTEKCPWRKKTLQGQVHDDNTYVLGGVSTHAGLFGRLEDVTMWAKLLRDGYYGKKGSKLASHRTIRAFTRRKVPPKVGDWALGFMMPSKGGSTAGSRFSPLSVGHTGFTGTSIWFDPKKDLVVAILSNRVHPSRRREKFKALRPQLHDAVVKCLLTGPLSC